MEGTETGLRQTGEGDRRQPLDHARQELGQFTSRTQHQPRPQHRDGHAVGLEHFLHLPGIARGAAVGRSHQGLAAKDLLHPGAGRCPGEIVRHEEVHVPGLGLIQAG